MSSLTAHDSSSSSRRNTRPLPVRPTIVADNRASTELHEFTSSPIALTQDQPPMVLNPLTVDETPQTPIQVLAPHLLSHSGSHSRPVPSQARLPKATGDDLPKDPSKELYETAMQSLVQSQLVAMGVVNKDGSPPQACKPMSVLRIRVWIAFCVAFFVFAPLISVLLGVNLHAKDMQYGQIEHLYEGRTIAFEVVLVAADPKLGILRMDWKIVEELNSPCSRDNLDTCTDVNIFFDTNLLRPEGTFSTQEAIMTSDRPRRPLFVFSARGFATKDVRSQRAIFRTQLALFSEGEHPSSLLYYPFDKYTSELVFFAEDARTNETVGVKLARTGGVAVGFEATVSHKTDRVVPPEVVEAVITLTRSTLVKSYSVVATIAIWIVTIILALVMITSVFFGFKQRPEVLLIPVATLFAFTTLRQSMPGAPDGFGDIIDLVGLVPCLALLSLTAALSLGVFLLSDPSATTRTLRWKNMHEAFPMLKRKGMV